MTMRVESSQCFFTSDLHFFHKAMANRRGYVSVEEMNDAIILVWNSRVPVNADVFLLGDVSFGGSANTVSVLGQLNGRIHLIAGNHDKGHSKAVRNMFSSIHDVLEIDVREAPSVLQRIFLSHFSHRVWNMHHYGAWHLYGHSHGSLPGIGKSMDVGIDTGEFYSYDLIKERLSSVPIHTVDYHRSLI